MPKITTARVRRLLVALLGLSLLVSACGGDPTETGTNGTAEATEATEAGAPDASGQELLVVATTTVLGDVVADLVGDAGTVEVVMDPGDDPHTFSPSAQDAELLRSADLVIANGLDLEEALLNLIEAAEEDGVEVLYVAEHLDPITFGELGEAEAHEDEAAEEHDHAHDEETETEDDHAHDHGGSDALDPHVWLDPVRMAEAAHVIAERLSALDGGEGGVDWEERADEVAADILSAHEEIEAILAEVPDQCRELVTNHDAFGYFAARYDFEVLGTVIPGSSTAADPSAREFSELVETVRSAGVPAIFAESSRSSRFAEALAAEVGQDVEVVSLYTESVGEGSETDGYTGMMVENARRIAAALDECT